MAEVVISGLELSFKLYGFQTTLRINELTGTVLDEDECAKGISECHPDATCTNTIGSRICQCNVGLFGDGQTFCLGKKRQYNTL